MLIKQLQIAVVFGEAFSFRQHPHWVLYHYFLKRLKRMLCVVTQTPCAACPRQNKCLYADLTAADFSYLTPLIVLDASLMPNRDYKMGDCLYLSLYLIGRATAYADFFNFIAQEIQERGFGKLNTAVAISVKQAYYNQKQSQFISALKLITPMCDSKDIFKCLQTRIETINLKSPFIKNLTPCPQPQIKHCFSQFDMQQTYHLGVQRCAFKGKLGKLIVQQSVVWGNWLDLIQIFGLSNYYWYGAGRVQIIEYQ